MSWSRFSVVPCALNISHQSLEKIPCCSQVSSLDLFVQVDIPQVQPFGVGCHQPLEHRPPSLYRTVLELVLSKPGRIKVAKQSSKLVTGWVKEKKRLIEASRMQFSAG